MFLSEIHQRAFPNCPMPVPRGFRGRVPALLRSGPDSSPLHSRPLHFRPLYFRPLHFSGRGQYACPNVGRAPISSAYPGGGYSRSQIAVQSGLHLWELHTAIYPAAAMHGVGSISPAPTPISSDKGPRQAQTVRMKILFSAVSGGGRLRFPRRLSAPRIFIALLLRIGITADYRHRRAGQNTIFQPFPAINDDWCVPASQAVDRFRA